MFLKKASGKGLMRIICWNVNGLRAVIKKNALDWINEMHIDILCLQEIKTNPDQITGLPVSLSKNCFSIWNPAKRPGYSGVVTFTNIEPNSYQLGLGIDEFDQEGRVIVSHYPDFVLANVYFPNGKRNQKRLDFKLEFYQAFLDLCDKWHRTGQRIIICGDLNTAHREIDLKNPKENQKFSGFLPEERAWIDKYLDHGFIDIYRVINPDKEQYTWWTYRVGARERNIGWRIDYFLISEELQSCVDDAIVMDEILGSDHCPIGLELKETKLNENEKKNKQ